MRLLIITSCTGEKVIASEHQLVAADFQQGTNHVARREQELANLLLPAAELYCGEQHMRVMRGVGNLREREVQ